MLLHGERPTSTAAASTRFTAAPSRGRRATTSATLLRWPGRQRSSALHYPGRTPIALAERVCRRVRRSDRFADGVDAGRGGGVDVRLPRRAQPPRNTHPQLIRHFDRSSLPQPRRTPRPEQRVFLGRSAALLRALPVEPASRKSHLTANLRLGRLGARPRCAVRALSGPVARDAGGVAAGLAGLPHFAPKAKRVIFLCMAGGPVAPRDLRLQAGPQGASAARRCRRR